MFYLKLLGFSYVIIYHVSLLTVLTYPVWIWMWPSKFAQWLVWCLCGALCAFSGSYAAKGDHKLQLLLLHVDWISVFITACLEGFLKILQFTFFLILFYETKTKWPMMMLPSLKKILSKIGSLLKRWSLLLWEFRTNLAFLRSG